MDPHAEANENDRRIDDPKLYEQLQVPNLDDLSVDPVDYSLLSETFNRLARYCAFKALSMDARTKGHTAAALRFERRMEEQYEQLPKPLKW